MENHTPLLQYFWNAATTLHTPQYVCVWVVSALHPLLSVVAVLQRLRVCVCVCVATPTISVLYVHARMVLTEDRRLSEFPNKNVYD
jgi:hypothetical protein